MARSIPIKNIYTQRVKGYTRFAGKYETGRRKRFRPNNGKYVEAEESVSDPIKYIYS